MSTAAYVKCFIIDYPQQLAIGLAFHQQAADELGGNDLSGAGEALGEVRGAWGGYGSGLTQYAEGGSVIREVDLNGTLRMDRLCRKQ